MSLLNTASTWTPKYRRNKRQSTMKKPSLISQDNSDTNENNLMLEGFKTNIPQSIEHTQNLQRQRNERINNLINNMNICCSVFFAESVNTTPVTGHAAQIRTS